MSAACREFSIVLPGKGKPMCFVPLEMMILLECVSRMQRVLYCITWKGKPKYAPEDDVSVAYREFSIALPG